MEETSSNNQKADEIEYVAEEEAEREQGKIGKLKRELEACKKDKEEYLQGWQRAKADYVNAERLFREREQGSIDAAKNKLLLDILEIADGFENAFASSPPDSKWVEGIRQLASNLASLLERHDVKPIIAKGEQFDPSLHEAIEMKEVTDKNDDNKILEEYQKGYIRKGKVLRPSKVKVGNYTS